jgi:hypothetical protein
MSDLRYPIGQFTHDGAISANDVAGWIDDIAELPQALRSAVEGLDDAQLDTPYRSDGWTVRQVVHHVPESHMNSYIRFKWALTEDEPSIKAYDEQGWAELVDGQTAPIAPSLQLLDALHARWAIALRSLTPDQLKRRFLHPDSGPTTLDWNIGMYAWHGKHHVAHIISLRSREGW